MCWCFNIDLFANNVILVLKKEIRRRWEIIELKDRNNTVVTITALPFGRDRCARLIFNKQRQPIHFVHNQVVMCCSLNLIRINIYPPSPKKRQQYQQKYRTRECKCWRSSGNVEVVGKESPRLAGVVQTIANPSFKLPGRDVHDARVGC